MFSIYLLGIIVALIVGLIMQKTVMKGESSSFVIEMPPYRIPTIKGVILHAVEHGGLFLRKAGVPEKGRTYHLPGCSADLAACNSSVRC